MSVHSLHISSVIWNCGLEGTVYNVIKTLKVSCFSIQVYTLFLVRGNWQMKNFHLALMISQVKPLPTYMNDIVVNNLI